LRVAQHDRRAAGERFDRAARLAEDDIILPEQLLRRIRRLPHARADHLQRQIEHRASDLHRFEMRAGARVVAEYECARRLRRQWCRSCRESIEIDAQPDRHLYLVPSGRVRVNGVEAGPRDGVAITGEDRIEIQAEDDSELVLVDAR